MLLRRGVTPPPPHPAYFHEMSQVSNLISSFSVHILSIQTPSPQHIMSFAPSSPPTTAVRNPSTPSTARVMPTNVTGAPSTPAQSNAPSSGTSSTTPGTDSRVRERQGSFGGSTKAKILKPFNTANIKILLLENVNETAVAALRGQGYQVSFGCVLPGCGEMVGGD